jgi:hypothetical protein
MSGIVTQSGMNVNLPSTTILSTGTTYNLNGGVLSATNFTQENDASLNFNNGTFSVTGNLNIDGSLNWASTTMAVGGTTTIGSTGSILITGDNSSAHGNIINTGTITKTSGTSTSTLNTSSLTNAGEISVTTGTLNLGTNVTQTAGSLNLNGGDITATTVTLNGGSLDGTGTITADVNNNASVNPDQFSSGITIIGDYVQGSAGSLNMIIAGTADGEYDRLIVSGQASLDGTLNVTPIAPYTDIGTAKSVILSTSSLQLLALTVTLLALTLPTRTLALQMQSVVHRTHLTQVQYLFKQTSSGADQHQASLLGMTLLTGAPMLCQRLTVMCSFQIKQVV